MKLDPYLNVDPGTMNPMQHGEVFVTDDGAETSGINPIQLFAKLTILRAIPPFCIRLPAITKNGIAISVKESTPFNICCAIIISGTSEYTTM